MIYDFLAKNPVFNRDDLIAYRKASGASTTNSSIKSLIDYYCKVGLMLRIRQNLFISNLDKDTTIFPLPYFIASKIAPDSVLAYHTAMMARGYAYSMFTHHYYLSQYHIRPLLYRTQSYQVVSPQKELLLKQVPFIETEIININGQKIKVTSIARTLVDSLDNPILAGGWEELWRNFDNISFFEWDNMLAYTKLINKAVLYAKLGFYLSIRQKQGMRVPQPIIDELSEHKPKQPCYIDSKRHFLKDQKWSLVSPWQLIVPEELISQNWEEVNQTPDIDIQF